MKTTVLHLLIISLFFISCNPEVMFYNKTSVDILEIDRDSSTIKVYFKVPEETMYYCSGIDIELNNIKEDLIVRFIRQNINSESKPEIRSNFIRETKDPLRESKYGKNSYKVEIPIDYDFLNNKSLNDILEVSD